MSTRIDRRPALPAGADPVVLLLVAAGFLLLYGPTYADLARTLWVRDEQGHGPIILAVAAWLAWRRRQAFAALPAVPAPGLAWPLFGLALLLYVIGRSQAVLLLEVGSKIPLLAALALLFRGRRGLRLMAFPLFLDRKSVV